MPTTPSADVPMVPIDATPYATSMATMATARIACCPFGMRWLALALLVACTRPTTPPPAPVAAVANVVAVHEPANPVRVDYKMRGYFYASAPVDEGLGGHAVAKNAPIMNRSS